MTLPPAVHEKMWLYTQWDTTQPQRMMKLGNLGGTKGFHVKQNKSGQGQNIKCSHQSIIYRITCLGNGGQTLDPRVRNDKESEKCTKEAIREGPKNHKEARARGLNSSVVKRRRTCVYLKH